MFDEAMIFNPGQVDWRFFDENDNAIPEEMRLISDETKDYDGFSVRKLCYAGQIVTNATRVFVSDGKFVSFFSEEFSATQKIKVYSSFSFACDKDFTCNVANKHRLVLRRGEHGTKLFRLSHIIDDEDITNQCGLLLPDGMEKQDSLRLTFYSGLYTSGKCHKVLYSLFRDTAERIKTWHLRETPFLYGETPEQEFAFGIDRSGKSPVAFTDLHRDGTEIL